MKVVTFNIRCDYGQDKNNNFEYRKQHILNKIKNENPDIIGFQEVLPHVAAWLKENLDDYYIIGCPRSEKLDDEQVSIAYKKDRMNLIRMETWWLSNEPFVPGSRYEKQSICPRVANEAVFEDMETKKIFRMINTHLDHEAAQARREGLAQILNKLENEEFWKNLPVILCGDFNAEPDSDEMKALFENSSLDVVTKNIGYTYHNFGKNDPAVSIDYIVLKGDFKCTSVEKWTDEKDGVYFSDHYPVCAIIE